MIPTWVVVPTKNRPKLVRQLLMSLIGQVVGAVVVDNNDIPDLIDENEISSDMRVLQIHRPGYPPNLSMLLNNGMDVLNAMHISSKWNVVLCNDDIICPTGWVESLSTAMRATTAVMAYTDRISRTEPILFTTQPLSPYDAATVCACMLRGEANVRFDERFLWWYGDTDLDFRCRQVGGVLAVPGVIPEHLHPSVQTVADPELTAQTHRDRETFDAKWKGAPW